ncbi:MULTISPECIES: amino acid ABC transporter permease [Oscillospiraceae]|uniref:amino acid ABC transporter permease n=1 Tax=Oscillospiraceae TaxID=216572 RepID=UPI0026CFB82D
MNAMTLSLFGDILDKLNTALLVQDRYKLILTGLKNTLLMAVFATIIGTLIGVIVAVIKYFAQGNKKLAPLGWVCDLYTTVIRGTPVVVQLLIWSTVILTGIREALPIAIIGFGINSGAYVAEIIRAGIDSIDKGQTEAGRSLGLNRIQTMRLIVMPQAVKNILPALANEFIALLKETSVAGYIAMHDLTKAGEMIKNNTFDGTALFVVAIIYLVLVVGMTKLLGLLERRLKKGDLRS